MIRNPLRLLLAPRSPSIAPIRVGPFISIGGTAPVGPDGKTVGVGDVAAQTRQCIEIINAALKQAGSGLQDVVRTRVILTNIDDWKAAIDVRKGCFRDAPGGNDHGR